MTTTIMMMVGRGGGGEAGGGGAGGGEEEDVDENDQNHGRDHDSSRMSNVKQRNRKLNGTSTETLHASRPRPCHQSCVLQQTPASMQK